jgi:hypothetical protein
MHRALLLLALATTDLCDTTSSTGAAGAGGSATTTVACDGQNECSTCTTCAINGPCATLYSACQQDSDCESIDQCFFTCGSDPTCQQECLDDNPDGVADYQAITTCIDCTQCAKDCVGLTTCS